MVSANSSSTFTELGPRHGCAQEYFLFVPRVFGRKMAIFEYFLFFPRVFGRKMAILGNFLFSLAP